MYNESWDSSDSLFASIFHLYKGELLFDLHYRDTRFYDEDFKRQSFIASVCHHIKDKLLPDWHKSEVENK